MSGRPPGRLLLKLSGEAFGDTDGAFSPTAMSSIADALAPVSVELAVVVGGGNIIRGARADWLGRVEADTLGMLATVLNALALRSCLERCGRSVVVQSALGTELTSPVSPRDAVRALCSREIVIFAGGTGSPLVTTDTAAALRAVSIDADLFAKGSNVAGVFSDDPDQVANATLLPEIRYDDYLARRYRVMDQIAVEICREHRMPIEVFDLRRRGAIGEIVAGRRVGTRID